MAKEIYNILNRFTDKEIITMDGRNALKFWRANKEPILALAKANNRNFEPFLTQEVA